MKKFVLLGKGDIFWPVDSKEILLMEDKRGYEGRSLRSGIIGLAVTAWLSSFDPMIYSNRK